MKKLKLKERRLHNLCDLCLREPCIDPRCPNYISQKTNYYCSVCGEGIYEGDEYIQNDNGEYRHWECFYGMRDLLEWLGYEIKTMENVEDEN